MNIHSNFDSYSSKDFSISNQNENLTSSNNSISLLEKVTTEILKELSESYLDPDIEQKYQKLIEKLKESGPTSTSGIMEGEIQKISENIFPMENQKQLLEVENQFKAVQSLIKAQKLLDQSRQESNVSPAELIQKAQLLLQNHIQYLSTIPSLAIVVHQLYDKAAEKLLQEGNIQEALKVRAEIATQIPIQFNHPLYDMNLAIETQTQKQSDPRLGAYFSSFDTGVVKGGNLHASNRNIEGRHMHCFDFKINPYARQELNQTMQIIERQLDLFKSSLPEGLAKEIKIKRVDYLFRGRNAEGVFTEKDGYAHEMSKSLEIEFVGLGKVVLCLNPKSTMYNQIAIEIEKENQPGEAVKTLHQMLTMLGLGPVLGMQRKEDDKRMQVAQLFRAYFPKEAYQMEQTREFFEMPVRELIETIQQQVPEMEAIFNKYLMEHPELMKKEEIYPGKTIWTIRDFSEQLREKGAWGLMSGLGTNLKDTITSLVLILKDGSLSSLDRFQSGLMVWGASSAEDLAIGGGDQVFTRLVTSTQRNVLARFTFRGKSQILYDLDVVNRVSYGYPEDKFGSKLPHLYGQRNNLFNLTERLIAPRSDLERSLENEVMIKNRIAPQFIRGILVPSNEYKRDLVQGLKEAGLIEVREGQEYINGKLLDQFILVEGRFRKEMWDK